MSNNYHEAHIKYEGVNLRIEYTFTPSDFGGDFDEILPAYIVTHLITADDVTDLLSDEQQSDIRTAVIDQHET